MAYFFGVGRQGFGWSGVATIHDKQEWPDWYPPKEMIERQPELRRQVSELQSGLGVPGGPRNPPQAPSLSRTVWQIHSKSARAAKIRTSRAARPQTVGFRFQI